MKPGEQMVFSQLLQREVSNYSDDWRHECGCRWLLREKPTRSAKHLFLYGVENRAMLMSFDSKTGKEELRDNHKDLWADPKHPPLMKRQGLEAADKMLADARKLYEMAQATT